MSPNNWLPDYRHQILRLAKTLSEELKEKPSEDNHPSTTDHSCFYPGCEGKITVSIEPGDRGDRLFWGCTHCSNGGSISL